MPRMRKHTFNKKYIDDNFKQAIYNKCVVTLIRENIENNELSLDNTTKEDGKTSKQNNIPIAEEPVKKKKKLDTNGINILKSEFCEGETHQFKSKVKSSLKPNKDIDSTSTEEVPKVIDCAKSTESANSSSQNVKSKIRVVDLRKFMKEDPEPSTSVIEGSLHSNKVSGVKQPLNGNNHLKWNLIEIEKLHNEYFSKCVQNNIVTIANILNIISICNEHLKEQLDQSNRKRSGVEKIKYICNARRLHERSSKILEAKLKNKFIGVTSSFKESEFDSAFIMFYLSILTVLRVLDHPKFGNYQELLEIVKQLLPESLINNEYNYPKLFSMFQSITFYSDCTNVLRIINDSWNTDPRVADRMPLYFLKTSNSLEYFKAAINAVTCDSNEDLSILIEDATFKCYYNVEIKDPIGASNVQHSNNNIPATEAIQSPINSHEKIQHLFPANQDEINPDIPVLNGNMFQFIGNTAVEPLNVTSCLSTGFYKSHSSSLQKKTSKVISTEKSIVTPTTISNNLLVQVTSPSSETATSTPPTTTIFGTLNLPIQNKKSVANSYLYSDKCRYAVIDNKPYQLVRLPSGQLRAVFMPIISNSPLMQGTVLWSETSTSTPTTTLYQSVHGQSVEIKALDNGTSILVTPTEVIRCDKGHCNNSATISCKCRKANYCSESCRKCHWVVHYADCEERQTRP